MHLLFTSVIFFLFFCSYRNDHLIVQFRFRICWYLSNQNKADHFKDTSIWSKASLETMSDYNITISHDCCGIWISGGDSPRWLSEIIYRWLCNLCNLQITHYGYPYLYYMRIATMWIRSCSWYGSTIYNNIHQNWWLFISIHQDWRVANCIHQ